MLCKACNQKIELVNIDPLLELCNKCYSISKQNLEDLLKNNQDNIKNENGGKL